MMMMVVMMMMVMMVMVMVMMLNDDDQRCQFSGKSLKSGPSNLFLSHNSGFLCTK